MWELRMAFVGCIALYPWSHQGIFFSSLLHAGHLFSFLFISEYHSRTETLFCVIFHHLFSVRHQSSFIHNLWVWFIHQNTCQNVNFRSLKRNKQHIEQCNFRLVCLQKLLNMAFDTCFLMGQQKCRLSCSTTLILQATLIEISQF